MTLTPLTRAGWWVQQVLLLRAGGPAQGADIPDTGGGAARLGGTAGQGGRGGEVRAGGGHQPHPGVIVLSIILTIIIIIIIIITTLTQVLLLSS